MDVQSVQVLSVIHTMKHLYFQKCSMIKRLNDLRPAGHTEQTVLPSLHPVCIFPASFFAISCSLIILSSGRSVFCPPELHYDQFYISNELLFLAFQRKLCLSSKTQRAAYVASILRHYWHVPHLQVFQKVASMIKLPSKISTCDQFNTKQQIHRPSLHRRQSHNALRSTQLKQINKILVEYL